MACSIWFRRNKIQCQEETISLLITFEVATTLLIEMKNNPRTHVILPQKKEITWKPPNHDMVKANYNGAEFKDSEEAGIEVVFRNACGEVMATISEIILYLPWWKSWRYWLQEELLH